MKDKDKEAFESWFADHGYEQINQLKAWQAACEYKQKEIDELNKYVEFQANVMCDMGEVILENEKLQAEINKWKSLRER